MDKYAIDVRNESTISLIDRELEIIWLRCAAHIHGLLASYYVDINANNWCPGDSVFDEAIHVKGEGARQLSQCLGSLPDHDTTIFSPAFDQGSSRP